MALIGLGLLAVPILLHLFKPRKVRVVPFSSLRWLRASQHRLSRRIQWHQILLFLLRAAFLSLLVLALARPVLALRRDAARAERFIILDASRTMQYASPGHPRPFDLGRSAAEQLLMQGLPGDRSTVLLADGKGDMIGPLAGDPSLYVSRVRALRAGWGESDLTGPLKLVPSMLAPKRPDAAVEMFFITGNYVQSWSQTGIARLWHDLATPVRVHVIHVGPDRPQNAWIADAEFHQTEQPLHRTIHARIGAAGDQVQARLVRLRIHGMADLTQKTTLQAGRMVAVEFEIPPALDLKAQVATLTLEPADALPSDDIYWLPLTRRDALRALVVESEGTQVPERQPGFHLRTALEALSVGDRGAIRVIRRSDTTFRASDLTEADVIVLADVPSLSEELVAALEAKVKTGAGLAVFLGPSINRDFYNTRLFNPLRPAQCLLPAEIGEVVDVRKTGGDMARLTDLQWSHPLLAPLYDPTFSDLAQVRVQRYALLKPAEGRGDLQTIAAIAHQTPAILEAGVGAGKVLLFNMTANDDWSDLPRRKSFVPLIDRVLDQLSGGLRRGTFAVGDTVTCPLPRSASEESVTVQRPDGQKMHPAIQTVAGRKLIQMEAVPDPGVYLVQVQTADGEERIPLIVQTGRKDSLLTPMDEVMLRRWWKPAEFESVSAQTVSGRVPVVEGRLPLDPWLMLLASLALAGEMLLVHWLCPKAPPKVVSRSRVSRHGFFATTTERAVPAAGPPPAAGRDPDTAPTGGVRS